MQLYLDDGRGPALVRVAVDRNPATLPSPGGVAVTIRHDRADCVRDTAVYAERPDGTTVEIDVATCLPADDVEERHRPSHSALSTDDAVRIATDERWGATMEPLLVEAGANRFTGLPVFSG